MSLEKELDSVLSEALPPRRDPPARLAPRVGAKPARPAVPTSPQKQKNPDFAAARKAMRKPMVNLDAQIHKMDQFLNVTQKDPSQLGSTVQQIEQSFEGLFDPLKQVRAGVKQLRGAADEFNADYVGEKPKGGLPEMQPGQEKPQKRIQALAGKEGRAEAPTSMGAKKPGVAPVRRAPDEKEDRYINKIVTDVEMVNRDADKATAAEQGWAEYQKTGGKMNRGEFYRALSKRLRMASDEQSAQESSIQRRKLV